MGFSQPPSRRQILLPTFYAQRSGGPLVCPNYTGDKSGQGHRWQSPASPIPTSVSATVSQCLFGFQEKWFFIMGNVYSVLLGAKTTTMPAPHNPIRWGSQDFTRRTHEEMNMCGGGSSSPRVQPSEEIILLCKYATES